MCGTTDEGPKDVESPWGEESGEPLGWWNLGKSVVWEAGVRAPLGLGWSVAADEDCEPSRERDRAGQRTGRGLGRIGRIRV